MSFSLFILVICKTEIISSETERLSNSCGYFCIFQIQIRWDSHISLVLLSLMIVANLCNGQVKDWHDGLSVLLSSKFNNSLWILDRQITDLTSYIDIINEHNSTPVVTVLPRKWFTRKVRLTWLPSPMTLNPSHIIYKYYNNYNNY